MKVSSQPRPQGLLLVQNGGSEKPLTKAAEILQDDELAFSEVVSSVWRLCLFSCNLKPLFKRKKKTSYRVYVTKSSRPFGAILAGLARGFSSPTF